MIGVGWLIRRLFGEVRAIRVQLERQNDLLERLANTLAPVAPTADPKEIAAVTGVDHLDATELQVALNYIARTERDTGHTPTDDEVLSYLADERTVDLYARLEQRERERERLAADRRGR